MSPLSTEQDLPLGAGLVHLERFSFLARTSRCLNPLSLSTVFVLLLELLLLFYRHYIFSLVSGWMQQCLVLF